MADFKEPPFKEPHDEMTFNTTPNYLTLIRIAFVPVVVAMMYVREPKWDVIAGVTFGIAAATDYFDGYIARTRKLITVYGKLMDPMADKFLTACTLIMLQELGRISAVVVMLLICRELAITGLRALASAEGVIIAASNSGKWKTGTQMVAIGFLIAQSIFGIPLNLAGLILLYISLAISLWSAQDYVVGFFKGVREARRTKSHERKIARQARMAARSARMANKAKRQPL